MAEFAPKMLGKIALITGAAEGIGAATARLFAKQGATLSLLDLDEVKLQKVAAECEQLNTHSKVKPVTVVGSVADPTIREKYVEKTLKELEGIDVLVNNAGITKYTSIQQSTLEDFDAIFDVNVRSIFHLTKLVVPHLKKSKGAIVNIASMAGHRVFEGRLVYGMSKSCLQSFTRYVAMELAKDQIRVNSISPALIRTKITQSYGIPASEHEKYFQTSAGAHALNRCGEAEEIADAILFLSSSQSSFMTGADIIIDGGLSVQPELSPTKY